MSEKTMVIWSKVAGPTVGKTGARFEWSVTARGDNTDELAQSINNATSAIKEFEMKLISAGCVPMDAYVDIRKNDRQVHKNEQPAPPPTANGNGNPPPAQPPQELTFDATLLVGSMNEGKTYWKVQGGRFSKHGVTIWPEALESAGFFVDNLDIGQSYDLTGYTAHYILNDKGNPQKVARLSK